MNRYNCICIIQDYDEEEDEDYEESGRKKKKLRYVGYILDEVGMVIQKIYKNV